MINLFCCSVCLEKHHVNVSCLSPRQLSRFWVTALQLLTPTVLLASCHFNFCRVGLLVPFPAVMNVRHDAFSWGVDNLVFLNSDTAEYVLQTAAFRSLRAMLTRQQKSIREKTKTERGDSGHTSIHWFESRPRKSFIEQIVKFINM